MAPGVLHFCGPGSTMSGNLRIQSDQSKERLVPRQRTAARYLGHPLGIASTNKLPGLRKILAGIASTIRKNAGSAVASGGNL